MATQREREYELVVVLTPEAGEAEAAVSVDRVAGYIADRGGTVSVRESWGVRRLAYPIQNYREGNYFLMRFELDAGETRELDQTLQASQDVLRHLVTIAEGPRPEPVEEPSAAAEAEQPAESGQSATEDGAPAEAEATPAEAEEAPSAEAEATPAATEEAPSAEAESSPAATEEAPSAEAESSPAAAEEEPVAEPEPPAAAESAEEAVASTAPETEKPAEQQERPA